LTFLHLQGSSKSLGGILLRFWRSKSVCAAMMSKSVLLLAFQLLGFYGIADPAGLNGFSTHCYSVLTHWLLKKVDTGMISSISNGDGAMPRLQPAFAGQNSPLGLLSQGGQLTRVCERQHFIIL
jgi:hypothetical protein